MPAKGSTPLSRSVRRSGSTASLLRLAPSWRQFWAVLLLLTATSCASDREPQQSRPPVDTGLRGQLAAFQDNPELCAFALAQEGAIFRPLPDTPIENGCGVTGAVRVESSRLSWNRPFPLTCPMAAALTYLERDVIQPAARRHFGQDVASATHYGTYACRNRNSLPAGRRSEHARANAIDVAGFELIDGTEISVLDHWDDGGAKGAFLREVHRGACGIFQGVIGPDSDPQHENHFHFDLGAWAFCD